MIDNLAPQANLFFTQTSNVSTAIWGRITTIQSILLSVHLDRFWKHRNLELHLFCPNVPTFCESTSATHFKLCKMPPAWLIHRSRVRNTYVCWFRMQSKCKVGCEAFWSRSDLQSVSGSWRHSIFAYRDNTINHYVVARRARRKELDDSQLQSVANKTSTLILGAL